MADVRPDGPLIRGSPTGMAPTGTIPVVVCRYLAVQVRVGAVFVPFQEALNPKLVLPLALNEPL